ncbi:MAG: nucleotide exchange factor GrpE [Deltaproteobacteria bacterium]|nr:nucleotide exchange factor GrpE [Deltaproteobacteria bacterium]
MSHKKKRTNPDLDGTCDMDNAASQADGSIMQDEFCDAPPVACAEVQDRVQALEQEKNDLSDRLLRAMAEFDNYRKRVTREKEGLVKYGTERIALEILPVVDSFERALEQSRQATEIEPVVTGLEMILKQLLSALEKFDIKPLHAVGEPFDPAFHEAMAQQDHPDHADNTVIEQVQKGYMLGDKLLRPARVLVSRAPAAPGED